MIDQALLNQKYIKKEKIGEGGFGQVFKCINIEQQSEYAMKIIKKGKQQENLKIQQEIDIQKSLKHQNICCVIDSFEDNQNFYLILELCEYSLASFLKMSFIQGQIQIEKLKEDLAIPIINQIINAFKYIHKESGYKYFLHRDLKPENFLIKIVSQQCFIVKMSDFGFSKNMSTQYPQQQTYCGTPNYIAPEVSERKPYNFPADVFSLGIIFYLLLYGCFPYNCDQNLNPRQQCDQLALECKKNIPDFNKNGVKISEKTKKLIMQMLKYDVKERFTYDELFKHDYFLEQLPNKLKEDLEEKKEEKKSSGFQIAIKNQTLNIILFSDSQEQSKQLIEAINNNQQNQFQQNITGEQNFQFFYNNHDMQFQLNFKVPDNNSLGKSTDQEIRQYDVVIFNINLEQDNKIQNLEILFSNWNKQLQALPEEASKFIIISAKQIYENSQSYEEQIKQIKKKLYTKDENTHLLENCDQQKIIKILEQISSCKKKNDKSRNQKQKNIKINSEKSLTFPNNQSMCQKC